MNIFWKWRSRNWFWSFLEAGYANMMMSILLQHGRQLLDSYRSLVDDLAQEDLDLLAHARSCSVSSIAGGGTGQSAGTPCSHSSSEPDQDQLQPAVAITPTYNHSFHGTVDGLPGRNFSIFRLWLLTAGMWHCAVPLRYPRINGDLLIWFQLNWIDLLDRYLHFRGIYLLHLQCRRLFYLEDEGSMLFQNFGNTLPDYTASYHNRQ